MSVVLCGCETWSIKLRVIENRVLGRKLGLKRDEVTGQWRKLHNGELNDAYCLQNIVRVNISRRMIRLEHVECMGERNCVCRAWWENLRERDRLEDKGVDERLILNWMFRKWDMGLELD